MNISYSSTPTNHENSSEKFFFFAFEEKECLVQAADGGGWDPSEPIVVGGLGLGEEGPKPPLERKIGLSFPFPSREASLMHFVGNIPGE